MLVAILTRETVHMAWALGFKGLIIPNGNVTVLSGMPFDNARNAACQQALDGGFSNLMFLDDDTIPPHDVIPRLLAHNLPIVSGVYYRRSPPLGLAVMLKDVKGPDGKLQGRQHVQQYQN